MDNDLDTNEQRDAERLAIPGRPEQQNHLEEAYEEKKGKILLWDEA
jgi:hypothetical protein